MERELQPEMLFDDFPILRRSVLQMQGVKLAVCRGASDGSLDPMNTVGDAFTSAFAVACLAHLFPPIAGWLRAIAGFAHFFVPGMRIGDRVEIGFMRPAVFPICPMPLRSGANSFRHISRMHAAAVSAGA